MLSLLLLLACGGAMEVTTIEPTELDAGSTLKVYGQNLDPEVDIKLLYGKEQGIELQDVHLVGETLEGTVPADAPTGRYDIFFGGDNEKTIRNALQITAKPSDNPCDTGYEVNANLSFERHQIIIWHTYPKSATNPKERRETHKMRMDEIKQVEFETVKYGPEEGDVCSVIYFRLLDGTRFIYDRDTAMDLTGRASRTAVSMGKPIEITRMDVEVSELDKPIESR